MRRPTRGKPDDSWLPLAGALLLGGPFWHALFDGRYPLDQPEAWLVPASAAVLGVLAVWLIRGLAEPWRTLGLAAMVVAFLDLQFDFERHVSLAVRGGAALAVLLLVYRHRGQIVGLALVTFYASSLIRPTPVRSGREAGPSVEPAPPLLIHLILDSHWSPGGFRSVGDTAAASALTAFYLDRGFTIADGAYSRYAATHNSIPMSLSLGERIQAEELAVDRFRMTPNPYFRELTKRGYRITAYQTTHLDFCSTAVEATCRTWHANAVGNIGRVPGRWWVRAQLAYRYVLAAKSPWVNRLTRGEPGRRESRPSWKRSLAGGGLSMANAALDEIAKTGGPGRAFVIHALLNHPPFDLGADCRGFDSVAERDAANRFIDGPARWAPHYSNAIKCAERLVDEFVRAADKVAGPAGSVIVVHGDHGPRLTGRPGRTPRSVAAFDGATMSSFFATLFAVRFVSRAPAIITAPLAIQPAFWSLVASGMSALNTATGPTFVVNEAGSGSSPGDTIVPLTRTSMAWVRQDPSLR